MSREAGVKMGSGVPVSDAADGQPALSDADRQRVLSALGIKLKFSLFVFLVLIALGAAMLAMVSEIFGQLTPSTRGDLHWKTQRGALELAERMELGIVLQDSAMLRVEAADYLGDRDVVGILVEGASGEHIFTHGDCRLWSQLRAKESAIAIDFGLVYGAWATTSIESAEVGRVGIFVSKERLFAGERLQWRMTVATFLGALLALALCLLFVNLYVGPILRLTADAFVRLETTTEAALEAARLKSQFLANMSHEIRTPMNGILGMLAVLRRTRQSTDQRRYSKIIETSAKGLLHIIDDVLDFSKLDAGKMVMRPIDFDLSEMLSEVTDLLASRAHDKRLELIVSEETDVPQRVHADEDRLRQVILNLVGNALKFTEVGHVTLRVERIQSDGPELTLRFSVVDTGVGIADDDLGALFESFSQVDGSLTRVQGGTGLGLAISSQLVKMLGGEFTVTSRVGEGSCFSFTCQVQRCKTCGPEVRYAPRAARVLIVSSAAPQRDHLRRLTKSWGMRVQCVGSCYEGIETLSTVLDEGGVFDAAILDVPVGSPDPNQSTMLDMCAGEDIPVLLLASAARISTSMTVGSRQVALHKPMRISEVYNGLMGLMDGTIVRVGLDDAAHHDVDSSRVIEQSRDRRRDGPLVLVVDDNAINREVAEELLAELGYRTETACNGQDAVEKAASGMYSAILMDCQMPVMDGHEATQQIRALQGDASKVPVIALTAHALAGDREQVLAMGMDDYASKPVQLRALQKLLQRWIPGALAQESARVAEVVNKQEGLNASPDLRILDPQVRRSEKVIGVFSQSAPLLVAAMLKRAESGEVEMLKSVAHKLKGGCLSLGAEVCAGLCQEIESRAAAGHIDSGSLAQISRRVDEAITAMLGGEREVANLTMTDPQLANRRHKYGN